MTELDERISLTKGETDKKNGDIGKVEEQLDQEPADTKLLADANKIGKHDLQPFAVIEVVVSFPSGAKLFVRHFSLKMDQCQVAIDAKRAGLFQASAPFGLFGVQEKV